MRKNVKKKTQTQKSPHLGGFFSRSYKVKHLCFLISSPMDIKKLRKLTNTQKMNFEVKYHPTKT